LRIAARPDLAIIAGKFIHVHADELAGELRVHVACVCERVSDGFVPVCKTVVDAFANDVADVTSHLMAEYLCAPRFRLTAMAGPVLALPPFTEIGRSSQNRTRVCELSPRDDQTGIRASAFYRIENFVERAVTT
jgi:hypothetical protein